VQQACADNNLALQSVRSLASIDLKNDEPGLLDYARIQGYTIDFYNRDQLNGVDGVSTSAVVLKATGAKGVAEPAAVLGAGGGRLLVKKMKWPNVTVAITEISHSIKTMHQNNDPLIKTD
jgi:cobalt-precorrin 5A hydrolase